MQMEIIFPGGKKVEALYKGFSIQTDQPENFGGNASAPSPFDLFLSSIGTCIGFYVLSFCHKRNLSTEGIKLILSPDKDIETRMIQNIKIEILLPSGFPEKYKEAVVNAANLCTVKKHLNDPPNIDIKAEISK